MKNPAAITVAMTLSKETTGSFRYDAAEKTAPIRDVYIRKDALAGAAAPRQVEVTFTPV